MLELQIRKSTNPEHYESGIKTPSGYSHRTLMQLDQMLICCAEDQGHWEQTGMQRRKDHGYVDVALEI